MEEATTSDAAARVQLVDSPVMSPGSCALCGKSKHDKGFAWSGLDFEFFGTLYLCGDCVGDYAKVFGWISPELADAYKQENVAKSAYIAQLEYELESFGDLKNAITNLNLTNLTSSDADAGIVHVADNTPTEVSDNEVDGVSGEQSEGLSGPPTQQPETELNTTELIDEPRPTSVSTIGSDADSILQEFGL